MKLKKLYILILTVMLAALSLAVLASCEKEERDPMFNYYDGGQEEFAFSKWSSGVAEDIFNITDGDAGQTEVRYSKFGNNEWPQIQSKVSGKTLSDFSYLNFTMSSNKEMIMQAQLVFFLSSDGEQASQTSLIGEVPFNVSTASKTYTYRISDSKRLMLDFIEDVWLFPEPGSAGAAYAGTFTIAKSWFSKAVPEGSEVINSNDDSQGGNAAVQYGKWSNETSWTKYRLTNNSDGEVDISFTGAAEWAMVTRKLTDYELADNMLRFAFINNASATGEPSIEHIRFVLRGDRKELVQTAAYSYWTYYDQIFDYQYNLANYPGTTTSQTVEVLLNISAQASSLSANAKNGLNLVIYIESLPKSEPGMSAVTYDKRGTMKIKEVKTYNDPDEPNYYNGSGFSTTDKYLITTNAQNTEMTVTYDFAPNNSQNMVYSFTAGTAGTYKMTVRNDSGHNVALRLSYKIGTDDSGDGEEISLATGASHEFIIAFPANADTIIFFIDSTTLRSGTAGGALTITNYGFVS